MGDKDEITQLIRKKSESFLKHALFQARGGDGAYDFEAEFAKTRKNKSYVVLGVTAVAILCLTVAAFVVTRVIEIRSAAMPINVSSFQDLNLKDILDSSKQDDAALERARTTLVQLGADLNSALEFADRDYRASELSINTLGLTASDQGARIAMAAKVRDAAKSRARADYAYAAAASRKDIATVQKRIDRYDSRSLAKAKAEQAILENERVAFDLEKAQQARLYESRIGVIKAAAKREIGALGRQKDDLAAALTSRYNPTFSDPRAVSLLSPRAKSIEPPLAAFDPYLGSAGVLDPSAETNLDASLSDLEYLSGKMLATPYLNSVPSALARIQAEARTSIAVYRGALQAAASGLESRDASIAGLTEKLAAAESSLEKFRSALVTYARENGESGYIIDARDPTRLLVLFDPRAGARDGDRGYIVREGRVVADISLSFDGSNAYAVVTDVEKGQVPRAFDSVLLAESRRTASK